MRARSRLPVCAALTAVAPPRSRRSAVSFAGPAWAGGSAADREAARTLAGKGYEAFEAKEYRRAVDLFRQAEARFRRAAALSSIWRARR